MSGIAGLRKRYGAERRCRPFYALPQLDDTGLMLGRGSLLARGDPAMKRDPFDDDGERLTVLLSATFGVQVSPFVTKHVRRAAHHWHDGDKALAHITERHLRAAEARGARLKVYFAEQGAADLVRKEFAKQGLERVAIGVLPPSKPKPKGRSR